MAERTAEEAPRGLITPGIALFLDFDGTLSPIQDDPDAVHLPEGGGAVLEGLAERLGGALALVSGRDGRDLARRTPQGLWRVGNHGGMVLSPGEAAPNQVPDVPSDLREGVEAIAADHPGIRLEMKSTVIAVHTRAVPDSEPAVLDALERMVGRREDYKVQHGKRVIELKPTGMDKGVIVERICAEAPFHGRTPIFVGDDTTDEDGFEAVIRLGGDAVKVGDGKTSARYRLPDVDAVWAWLKEGLHAIT